MSSTNIGASIITGSQSTTSSGGLGSGINVSALVAAAMANQTAELNVLQGQQSQITTEQTDLNTFNTDLQSLSNAVFALTDPAGQLTSTTATSSDPTVATASSSGGASIGNHTVVVNSLATTSTQYLTTPVATSSTAIPTGTLTIQVGTNTAVPIAINSGNNTLAGLAETINSSTAGVTASVITDASGARLAIVSNTSGAPGDLTITPPSGMGFTKAVTGVNGSATVDGIPIATTSNTVNNAIAGVTLNLVSANPKETVSIATNADVTTQASAINNFVTAYNKVVTDLNNEFAIDPQTGQPGPGASDSTLALAQSQILSTISFSMTGNGSVNSMADLGITMNNDGTLSVDNSTLSAALAANPSAVQNFFAETGAGSFGQNLSTQINAFADPLTGSIATDIAGLQQSQSSITQQIADFQTQLTTTQQQLTAQFDQVDTVLQELPLLLQQTQQQLASIG